MTREEILRTLRATPERVHALVRDLAPAALARPPAPEEWSLGAIVNHLLLGERDVILPRLQRMRAEEAPVFGSSLADRSGFAAGPRAGDVAADLAAFRRVRAETLTFLEGLSDGEWQRPGTTPTRGTLTIEAYARYLAEHDLEHIAQVEATRARLAG